MIKSELAHVRADYEHKQNELIRHKDEVSMVSQESETMHRQIQLLFEANKKLHETNESLRDALDSRASVIKQFNLRTPSPNFGRAASEGIAAYQNQARDSYRFPAVATYNDLPTEEEDSGLVISFDDANCSSDSDKPKGDIQPIVGLHSATGPAERTFRVVMCGEAAVGKSSLVMRLISGKHCANLPSTLGVDFHVKTVNVDGRNVALQLWDTAGQERFRSLCKSYFRRADGAILVYDVSSEHSFIKVRDWIDTIKIGDDPRMAVWFNATVASERINLAWGEDTVGKTYMSAPSLCKGWGSHRGTGYDKGYCLTDEAVRRGNTSVGFYRLPITVSTLERAALYRSRCERQIPIILVVTNAIYDVIWEKWVSSKDGAALAA
ncbi:hypothetical protein KIN20_016916, partial [Parelaphostrongylus tenuis]